MFLAWLADGVKLLLRLASVAAAVAMLVHAAALAVPSINASLYSPAYPWWRHIVFIAINGTLAWIMATHSARISAKWPSSVIMGGPTPPWQCHLRHLA